MTFLILEISPFKVFFLLDFSYLVFNLHKIEKEDKIILIVMSCGETAAVRVCKSDKSFEGRHWGELAVF